MRHFKLSLWKKEFDANRGYPERIEFFSEDNYIIQRAETLANGFGFALLEESLDGSKYKWVASGNFGIEVSHG